MKTDAPALTEARRLPEEGALYLRWSDDFAAKPSYRYLCGFCPCAGCQGHGGKISFHDPGHEVEPSKIESVGNYAISIGWKDGCQDGIYSFGFLRKLCDPNEEGPAGPAISDC